MFYLGHWHLMRGERAQAVRSFREARAITTATGDRPSIEFNAARVELLAMGERVE